MWNNNELLKSDTKCFIKHRRQELLRIIQGRCAQKFRLKDQTRKDGLNFYVVLNTQMLKCVRSEPRLIILLRNFSTQEPVSLAELLLVYFGPLTLIRVFRPNQFDNSWNAYVRNRTPF